MLGGTPSSISSFLGGSRVYRGGLPNPNSGTVDPSGYITRSLNQSNRRSGLAATALRLQQQRSNITPGNIAAPVHLQSINPTSHTVTTSPTGKIQLVPINQPATDTSNVLPFDPQSAAQQLVLQKQNDDFMNSLQQKEQQLGENTTTQERNVDLAAPGQYRNLLNNFAARGMANSSGYGYQYGTTADSIANQKADLERQLQEGLANYQAQAQQQQDNYNLSLGQLQTGSAEGMTPDQYTGLSGPQTPVAALINAPVNKKQVTAVRPKQTTKKSQQAAAKRIANKKNNTTRPIVGKK